MCVVNSQIRKFTQNLLVYTVLSLVPAWLLPRIGESLRRVLARKSYATQNSFCATHSLSIHATYSLDAIIHSTQLYRSTHIYTLYTAHLHRTIQSSQNNMAQQVTNDEPKSFLSLPRELRQEILALAFEDAYKQDLKFNANLIFLDIIMSTRGPYAAPHVFKIAAGFNSVHPLIEEDVQYVLDPYLDKMENIFKDSPKMILEQVSNGRPALDVFSFSKRYNNWLKLVRYPSDQKWTMRRMVRERRTWQKRIQTMIGRPMGRVPNASMCLNDISTWA